MDSARPSSPKNLYTLSEAAQYLAVSVDVLIGWNEHDILKPTINSTGEIVYSKSQIDKFKSIQDINNNSRNISNIPRPTNNNIGNPITDKSSNQNLQQNNYSQVNNYNFYNQSPPSSNENLKHNISLKGIFATFGFFVIAVLVVVFSQQSNLDSIISQNSEEDFGYDSHNSTIEKNNANELGVEYKKLQDQGNAITERNSSSLNKAFNNENNTESINDDEKLSLVNVIVGNNIDKSSLDKNNETVTYGQKANLRTETQNSKNAQNNDTVSEVFDTNGNIKVSNEDPTEKDLLATAFGSNGFYQNQNTVRKNSNTAGVVTFLILGLLFIYFLQSTRRQLLPSSAGIHNDLALQPISFSPQNDIEWEKILELDQKTDGSVVIIFHGKEYRISKPELDSESDKFIERLMQLTNSDDAKDIEYDVLNDPNLNLNTPLSKLVTRLGFVGVKRDLFFPRTSKSRVLFRKFLTLDDLFSMNLTIDQLSEDFDLIN